MNINDLQPGSFTVTKQGTGAPIPTNVSQLPAGSFTVQPPAPAAPQPSLLSKLGGDIKETVGNIGGRIQAGAQALDDSASGKIEAPEAGLRIFGQVVGAGNDLVGGAVKAGLQTANAATGGALGNAAKGGLQAIAQTPLGAMGISAIKGGAQKWQDFTAKYPRAAEDLKAIPEAAQMLANFVGAGAAVKGAEVAAPLVKDAVTGAVDVAKATAVASGEKASAKALQTTIDAVTPEFKGKTLTQAYKDVVRGTRDVKEGGAITAQAIGTSEREAGVGKRLFDAGIRLQNKPLKDTITLRDALKSTESELEDTLKGSKSEFGADKIPLINKLNKINTQIPREFKAIKDNGKLFKDVVDFGKETILKAQDDIKGLRDARTAFDAQAKIEFPSAYVEGSIDLKTPAGRAIKAVRDTINDHLYATAPEGSKIKELIGREADIFRATDAVAPRAAAGEGKSLLQKGYETAKAHPLYTGGAVIEGLKHTIAPQLPGF